MGAHSGRDRRRAERAGATSETGRVFTPLFTQHQGHAIDLAEKAARAGHPLVIAMGGDGTISEVANGLMKAQVADPPAAPVEMGILPKGTGGFQEDLGLPANLKNAAAHIRKTPARTIDLGKVTFQDANGHKANRYFINVSSFGFSAAVAARANNAATKKLGGKIGFLDATVRTLFSYDPTEVELVIDGEAPVRTELLLGAVGNAKFFGGGMKICPEAEIDSGQFSVTLVRQAGNGRVLMNLPKLFSGGHRGLKEVTMRNAKILEIRPIGAPKSGDRPAATPPVELDGETPGFLGARYEIVPGALRLRG